MRRISELARVHFDGILFEIVLFFDKNSDGCLPFFKMGPMISSLPRRRSLGRLRGRLNDESQRCDNDRMLRRA